MSFVPIWNHDRALPYWTTALTAAALCFAAALPARAFDAAPAVLVDSQKLKLGYAVHVSLDVPHNLGVAGATVYAPLKTAVWVDTDGNCRNLAAGAHELTLTSAQIASRLCWIATDASISKLLVQLKLPDNQTRWMSGPSVEFYTSAWFNGSFWTGVISTLMGTALGLGSSVLLQMFQARRGRLEAKEAREAERQKEREQGALAAEVFLAHTLFPSIRDWRAMLELWKPNGPSAPTVIQLGASLAALEEARARQLASYFSDLGKGTVPRMIQNLHAWASSYNELAIDLNNPIPSDPEGKKEYDEKVKTAVATREKLLAALNELQL